ncbi:Diphthamide biosynthesis protein 2, partial [Perkinsus olseni]
MVVVSTTNGSGHHSKRDIAVNIVLQHINELLKSKRYPTGREVSDILWVLYNNIMTTNDNHTTSSTIINTLLKNMMPHMMLDAQPRHIARMLWIVSRLSSSSSLSLYNEYWPVLSSHIIANKEKLLNDDDRLKTITVILQAITYNNDHHSDDNNNYDDKGGKNAEVTSLLNDELLSTLKAIIEDIIRNTLHESDDRVFVIDVIRAYHKTDMNLIRDILSIFDLRLLLERDWEAIRDMLLLSSCDDYLGMIFEGLAVKWMMDDVHDTCASYGVLAGLVGPTTATPGIQAISCELYKDVEEWIVSNNYQRIALQFPDSMLKRAPAVCEELSHRLPQREVFVIGDTKQGSCCVDEVNAEHYAAHCIVHFGHSCHTMPKRLPTYYIYNMIPSIAADGQEEEKDGEKGKQEDDDEPRRLYDELKDWITNSGVGGSTNNEVVVMLIWDTNEPDKEMEYGKALQYYASSSSSSSSSLHVVSAEDYDQQQQQQKQRCVSSSPIATPPLLSSSPQPIVIFMGDTTTTATTTDATSSMWYRLQLHNPTIHTLLMWDGSHLTSSSTDKLQMQRYRLVEEVKKAKKIGILFGSVDVPHQDALLNRIKEQLFNAGREVYIFNVGQSESAKLANFPEIECYVMLSCPESFLWSTTDYMVPVATPYELE